MSSDDGYPTSTSEEQHAVEREVLRQFGAVLNRSSFRFETDIKLHRQEHISFLKRGPTDPLRASFLSLEASQPWIVYWILHALDLLGEHESILREFAAPNIFFLNQCQHPSGGFGGGPGQIPHLATTYAAVSALVTIGNDDALDIIDRVKLYEFLLSMKDPVSGGFRMHEDGETDMRGTYCAISVASITGILDPALSAGVGQYVSNCQTYEGGIAGEPGMEAHGGYSYCGLAALAILGQVDMYLDTRMLLEWLARKQMPIEGGFQGRANKLVDSCYSFWQGAAFRILTKVMFPGEDIPLMSSGPAQMYILLACQNPEGGLRDKPGKHPDFYHSCYSLSGLAALQEEVVVGTHSNVGLERNNVLYNVVQDRVDNARQFWKGSVGNR